MKITSRISLLFSLLLLATTLVRGAELVHRDMILYSREQIRVSEYKQPLLDSLARDMRADSTMRVAIYGYGDIYGSAEINEYFSYERARWVASYLAARGADTLRIHFEGRGIDYATKSEVLARRVDIFERVERDLHSAEVEAEMEQIIEEVESGIEREPEVVAEPMVLFEEEVEVLSDSRVDLPSPYAGVSLRTNLLYWLAATPNVGVEWRSSSAVVGLVLNVGYAPLSSQSWEHNFSGYFASPELRFYMGRRRGGYMGVQLAAAGYNVKLTDTGYQGELYGAGLVGGWRIILSRNFDLDFSLGAGYGVTMYDSYIHHSANDTCTYISRDVEEWRWMPLQAGVSLIWKINKSGR